MQLVRRLAALAAMLCVAGIALPAEAIPSNTKIDRVFRYPCAEDVCSTERGDTKLASGDNVRGILQIQVSSSSSLGLDSARLDARRDDGNWVCIKHWDLSASNFSGVFNWNTNLLPGACPEGTSGLSRNGSYDLRLVAREKTTGDQQVSSLFTVDVSNRPDTPRWADDLSVQGAGAREPVVTMRFLANPEPDVVEYHYVRLDPSGSESEWAISATKPGGQGCDVDGDTFTCFDDDFSSHGFGGTYTYALIAYRNSPTSTETCALPPQGRCVQSSISDTHSITIDEPAVPSPEERTTPGERPASGGSAVSTPGGSGPRVLGNRRSSGGSSGFREFYTGTYDPELPYNSQPYAVPKGSKSAANTTLAASLPDDAPIDRSQMWQSIAGGLLMMLGAAHAARVLRRS